MWPLVRRLKAAALWVQRARRKAGLSNLPLVAVLHVACVEPVPDSVLCEALQRAGLASLHSASMAVYAFRDKHALSWLTDSDLRVARRARVRLMERRTA